LTTEYPANGSSFRTRCLAKRLNGVSRFVAGRLEANQAARSVRRDRVDVVIGPKPKAESLKPT
jgi:hypothetical protein